MDTSSNVSSIQDAPIGLQQLKLPDLETDLYLGYAGMIANLEKKLSDDAALAVSDFIRENKSRLSNILTKNFPPSYGGC